MKIGVNARLLTKPFTGIGQVTKNIFCELAKIDSGNEYVLIVPSKIDPKLKDGWPRNLRVKVLAERKIGTAGMRKTWWEQITLPEYFEKQDFDMVFYTYPSNPWSKDWYKKEIKTVVMVHDCIPWTNKSYNKRLMSKLYNSQTRKAVKLADAVITVSDYSKKQIVKSCGVGDGKISVVYNDASAAYKENYSKEFEAEVLARFSLVPKKYFLYVGGYDKRKNVKFMVNGYSQFAKEYLEEIDEVIPLVLAGGKLFNNKLYSSFNFDNVWGNIVKTGFLEEKSLAVLYKNCLAFVNFSSEEGFNIPILEAANCSAPIVVSDILVHREVCGGNALLVDIDKGGTVKKALNSLLDGANRKDLVGKSNTLANEYSIKRSAKKLKDVLFS